MPPPKNRRHILFNLARQGAPPAFTPDKISTTIGARSKGPNECSGGGNQHTTSVHHQGNVIQVIGSPLPVQEVLFLMSTTSEEMMTRYWNSHRRHRNPLGWYVDGSGQWDRAALACGCRRRLWELGVPLNSVGDRRLRAQLR